MNEHETTPELELEKIKKIAEKNGEEVVLVSDIEIGKEQKLHLLNVLIAISELAERGLPENDDSTNIFKMETILDSIGALASHGLVALSTIPGNPNHRADFVHSVDKVKILIDFLEIKITDGIVFVPSQNKNSETID